MTQFPLNDQNSQNHFNPRQIFIRRATSSDARAIARVQIDSYKTAYVNLMPEAYLAAFTMEEQELDWVNWTQTHPEDILLVAVNDEDVVVGYSLNRASSELEGAGEVAALHIDPIFKGHGIGKRLLQQSAKCLQDIGCVSLLIWTLVNNPSRGFYEHLGGVLSSEKDLIIDELDFSTKEVCYVWQDLKAMLTSLESIPD